MHVPYFQLFIFFSDFCDVNVDFCPTKPVFYRVHFAVHFLHFNLKWIFFESPFWPPQTVFLFMFLCSNCIEEVSFWSSLETQIRSVCKMSHLWQKLCFLGKHFMIPQHGPFFWTMLSFRLPGNFSLCAHRYKAREAFTEPVFKLPVWLTLTPGMGGGRKDRFRFTEVIIRHCLSVLLLLQGLEGIRVFWGSVLVLCQTLANGHSWSWLGFMAPSKGLVPRWVCELSVLFPSATFLALRPVLTALCKAKLRVLQGFFWPFLVLLI